MTDFDDTLNEIMNYGETGQSLALSDMYAAALARAEAAEAEALKQARRAEEAEAERDDLRESLDAAEEERNGQAILLADELNDARIEAAEAERDDANIAASLNKSRVEEMVDRLSFEMKRREALAARVAELEAQLAAAHLNPYNTAPLGEHVIVTLRTEGWRDEDGLWDWDDYGDWDVVGWQPLPPAPDMEPTP